MLDVKTRIEQEFFDLKEEVKEKLIKAAEWRSCNPGVNIIQGFDEDVFDAFCASSRIVDSTENIACKEMEDELKVRVTSIEVSLIFLCHNIPNSVLIIYLF